MLSDRLKSFWSRAGSGLLGLTLFVAFWQWRHTFYFAYLGDRYFEYASLHIYAADILALLVVVLAAALGWRSPRAYKGLVWASAAVLGWITLSTLWAGATLPALVRVGEFWLWALFAHIIEGSIIKLIGWLVGGVLVSGVVGMGQYLGNHSLGLQAIGESVLIPKELGMPVVISDGGRQLRASGLAPHPNILGGVVLWGLHWLWLKAAALKHYSWVVSGLGIFMIAVLVLSWTRSAWIAALVTGIMACWWAWRRGAKLLAGQLIIALVAGVLILVSQQEIVAARFWVVPSALEDNSVTERVAGFEQWQEVMEGNWLLGVGVGNYPMALSALHPDWPEWEIKPVHNIYLLWVAELGSVGAFLAIWFMVMLVGYIRRSRVGLLRIMPMIAWLVMGLFDHWPLTMHQGYVGLFLALALIFAESDVS